MPSSASLWSGRAMAAAVYAGVTAARPASEPQEGTAADARGQFAVPAQTQIRRDHRVAGPLRSITTISPPACPCIFTLTCERTIRTRWCSGGMPPPAGISALEEPIPIRQCATHRSRQWRVIAGSSPILLLAISTESMSRRMCTRIQQAREQS